VQDIIIIKHHVFAHYSTKTHLFLDKFVILFLSHNFKIMIVSMTMAFYGLKMHQYMEFIQMKKLKILLINTFHVMYHYYHLRYKMHNNINTFKHVRKKNHVVCRFHYPLLPMSKTTILKQLKLEEDLPFSKTICNNKQFFFGFFKRFKN